MLEPPAAAQPPPDRSPSIEASGERSVAIGRDNRGTIITGDVLLPWFRTRRQQALAIALLLVVLLGAGVVIYQFIRPLFEPQPQMIGGSIKIAVGGFDGVEASGRAVDPARTDDLAAAVFKQLTQVAQEPSRPSAVIWSTAQTGHVTGPTAPQRAKAIDADIIVYGTLRVTTDATHLQPRFYVTARQLSDAEELAGDYSLGQEIVSLDDFTRNSATYDDLKNKLVGRVSGLEDVLYGLNHYRRDELDAASASFNSADSNVNWVGNDGKEILFLFAGFSAGKRNDPASLAAAAQYFNRAAALERTRARAELGSAEVLLEQSGVQQDCAAGAVDVALLHQAAAAFEAAMADTSAPPAANIRPKAQYGKGQVDVCLSQSGREDRWADAQQQFTAVIADYDAGNAGLKSLAAESHAQLGLIAQPFADETDPRVRTASYERSANEYRQAIALSGEAHPARQAYFSWSLGLAEERLGNFDQAETAYATAASTPDLDSATQATYQHARDRVHALAAGVTPVATP